MEVSSVARMILYPTNADDRKYSFNPVTAICCKSIFFSLLKTAVICWAKRNISKYTAQDTASTVTVAYFDTV